MTILDQSLCLLDGVSPEAEIRFRREGILTCRQLAMNANRYFSSSHSSRITNSFREFEIASKFNLVSWFVGHLPIGHRVRAICNYHENTVFYDIETDGMAKGAKITCITTLRAGDVRTFVRGQNLGEFLEELSSATILVGFNSKRFDTPFIMKEFALASVPPQIDLMDEAAHYGLRGGLKKIEKLIGVRRLGVDCENGAEAVEKWQRWKDTRDRKALDSLIAYNREDVLSLQVLYRHILAFSLENGMFSDN